MFSFGQLLLDELYGLGVEAHPLLVLALLRLSLFLDLRLFLVFLLRETLQLLLPHSRLLLLGKDLRNVLRLGERRRDAGLIDGHLTG